jgi:hypothetical protein
MAETTAKINIELVIFSRMRNSMSVTGAILDIDEIILSPKPNVRVNKIIAMKINGSYYKNSHEIISATSLM